MTEFRTEVRYLSYDEQKAYKAKIEAFEARHKEQLNALQFAEKNEVTGGGVGTMSTDQMLSRADNIQQQDIIHTGISGKLILTWTNHADLYRVKGIGPQFAELLEAAGVDTVKELGHRNAANLAAKMLEVNEEKHLVRRVPVEIEVQRMIDQAKELPGVMTY